MTEIKFNASVKNIMSFEKTTGKSLMSAFSGDNASMTTIVQLIEACSDADVDTIDAYIKENGIEKLTKGLEQALIEAGFLPKSNDRAMTTGA